LEKRIPSLEEINNHPDAEIPIRKTKASSPPHHQPINKNQRLPSTI
jgi:hypothetical protein